MKPKQNVGYFLVWSINVTSLKDMRINPEEIIKIQIRCVRSDNLHFEEDFSVLVRPNEKPKLSPHCIKTTGKYLIYLSQRIAITYRTMIISSLSMINILIYPQK